MTRTYRMDISGSINERHFQTIYRDLVAHLQATHEGSDPIVVSNPQRSSNSTEITVEIPDKPVEFGGTDEQWFAANHQVITEFINDSRVAFEEITP